MQPGYLYNSPGEFDVQGVAGPAGDDMRAQCGFSEHQVPEQIQHLVPRRFIGKPWRHKVRSEEHTSELQSRGHLVCRLLLEKKKISATEHGQQDKSREGHTRYR